MKDRNGYIVMLVFFIIVIIFFIYNTLTILKNPVTVKAYAIQYFEGGTIPSNRWEYLYFYDNKFYKRNAYNPYERPGAVDLIVADGNNLENYYYKKKQPMEKNKMIYYGAGFYKNDSICFFGNNRLLKSFKIDYQFGVILELYKKSRVELYRNNKLFARYNFNLPKTEDLNFFPLQLKNPVKKIEKNIFLSENGHLKVICKRLNNLISEKKHPVFN